VCDVTELAPVAWWNVHPRGLHHGNSPVRGTGQQLVTGRTESSGSHHCE